MENVPATLMTIEGTSFWICDQSDHTVFVRNDLRAEYVPKTEKFQGYSSKYQELEVLE
jgi:hypothetical protein